jgi:hypothetical protein
LAHFLFSPERAIASEFDARPSRLAVVPDCSSRAAPLVETDAFYRHGH